ncbi:MAG: 4-hydroxy-tetrahydrodipicolinate reductase [Caulobacteraceae bacterium]|nr:4-hydroxy-tetrahydrodipicolinate reductase [Caulobacteraceae bacterium]
MTEAIRIGVAGALGRMGRAVETLVAGRDDVRLAARLDRPGAADDAAHEMPLADFPAAAAACDVIVDFSTASASAALAAAAAGHGGPALVIGATGFTPAEDAQVRQAAKQIAIVRAGNFSLGVNLLAALVEEAARRLPAADWDIEIFEAHHRRKIDAPSGTALLLGEAATHGRGETLDAHALAARSGVTGARPRGGVGFASLRGGGIVGEHAVLFAGEEETITLSHSARDRALFARGALTAALWVHGKPAGLYGMREVLGL